jgi:hypothetical protein
VLVQRLDPAMTAHDEMIVAMNEYAYRVISCGLFDAETRGSGTG